MTRIKYILPSSFLLNNFVRNATGIIFLFLLTNSCGSEEIKVNFKDIKINIAGSPGPWIKSNDKYYCYFKIDNDDFNRDSNQNFYILDKNGKTLSQIDVPEEIQTFYYDLYVKNDTIFTTEYYNHDTFFLDEKNEKWEKTEKGIDLYYEDNHYTVYSLDLGEWGGTTWFKDKQSNKQYEIGATTPIVNSFNSSYYLTESHSILKIHAPLKMDLSKQPYDYKKDVLDEKYFREGSSSTNGATVVFKKEAENLENPTFSIATSFISNSKLYHLYRDSLATKIGTLVENELIPIYTFKSKIKPIVWYYDTRNRIQNNKHQTVQFLTEKENVYGIIEIDEKGLNVVTFENLYKEKP